MSTLKLCAFLSLLTRLHAQTNAGALTGTITDQQRAAMNGVKVVATNVATNVQQSSTKPAAPV